jgi:hypothetical protein
MPDSDAHTETAGDVPDTYARQLGPTAPDDGGERDPDELADALRAGREKWSNLSLEEILIGYRRVIWPRLDAEGNDPETTVPTQEWLREHGHRNLQYALRE